MYFRNSKNTAEVYVNQYTNARHICGRQINNMDNQQALAAAEALVLDANVRQCYSFTVEGASSV